MFRRFSNKVVLVTGGNSGIGAEIVRQLAKEGAVICVVSRSEPALPQENIDYIQYDMADSNQAKLAYDAILNRHGSIDYVFNSAGALTMGEIIDTPLEDWHSMLKNNVATVMNSCHYAFRIMAKQGHGHIINIGSAAGLFPVIGMGVYGASKYAVTGLTQALRIEAKQYNVKVTLAAPTTVNTELYDKARYHNFNYERLLAMRGKAQTPERAAIKILKGTEKNKTVVTTSILVRLTWILHRYAPLIYGISMLIGIRQFRKYLKP